MDEKCGVCCFTGHRTAKLPWGGRETDERCLQLKEQIYSKLEELYARGFRRFICGMAIGCDTYFADCVLRLRELHPDVRLEAAVPCSTQSDKWNSKQKAKYKELLSECDDVNVLQPYYTPDCMLRRNEYMVDSSHVLLACFDGRPGGTMKTILYARRSEKEIIIIDI